MQGGPNTYQSHQQNTKAYCCDFFPFHPLYLYTAMLSELQLYTSYETAERG
jgi:hypothetical protein